MKPQINTHVTWSGRTELILDETFPLQSRPNRTKKAFHETIVLLLNETTDLKRDLNYTLRATLIDNRHCEGRIKDTQVYCKCI